MRLIFVGQEYPQKLFNSVSFIDNIAMQLFGYTDSLRLKVDVTSHRLNLLTISSYPLLLKSNKLLPTLTFCLVIV